MYSRNLDVHELKKCLRISQKCSWIQICSCILKIFTNFIQYSWIEFFFTNLEIFRYLKFVKKINFWDSEHFGKHKKKIWTFHKKREQILKSWIFFWKAKKLKIFWNLLIFGKGTKEIEKRKSKKCKKPKRKPEANKKLGLGTFSRKPVRNLRERS